MHAEVSCTALALALQQLTPIVSAKPSIPILAGIRVDADPSCITLTAGTIGMLVQYKLPMIESTKFTNNRRSIVVPGRSLYELVRRLDTTTLILETSEDYSMTIRSGMAAYRLCGMDAADYPAFQLPDIAQPAFCIPKHVLQGMIQQVAFAVSASEARPALTGVHVQVDSAYMTLLATDGIRLASNQTTVDNNSIDIDSVAAAIVPGKHLTALSRMINNVTGNIDISIDNQSILFRTDRLLMQSSLLPGTFPSTENLVPDRYTTEVLLDTAAFIQSLERVNLLAGSSNAVRMQHTLHRTSELSARTTDIGEAVDTLPLLDMTGDPLSIHYNGKYMLEILRVIDAREIWLRMTGPERPIIIQPHNSSSAYYILTPIRSR